MSKSYVGVTLPDLPSDITSYPYAFIVVYPEAEYSYRLVLCTAKYYYQASDSTLQPSGGSMRNYWVTKEQAGGDTWEFRNDTNYYYSNIVEDTVLWSNYDIPNGSGSTDIYFYAAGPTPLSLVQQVQTAVGNGVSSCTLTMSNCTPGNTIIVAYAVRCKESDITLSNGWTQLGGGSVVSSYASENLEQRVFFAYKTVTDTVEIFTITQNATTRIYVVASEYANVGAIKYRGDLSVVETGNYTVTAYKDRSSDIMLYAVTVVLYGSGRGQTVSPDDLSKLYGDASAERLACWFDAGSGAKMHTFKAYAGTDEAITVVECLQLIYKPPGSNCIWSDPVNLTVGSNPNNFYTKEEIDAMLGNIAAVLDKINGEVV